jgi:translation initiation factor IF-3
MTLYGRENQHKDIGVAVFQNIKKDLAEICRIESDVKIMKNKIFMLIVPK